MLSIDEFKDEVRKLCEEGGYPVPSDLEEQYDYFKAIAETFGASVISIEKDQHGRPVIYTTLESEPTNQ